MESLCNICNKTFSSVFNLNKHLKTNKVCSNYNINRSNKVECMWCKGLYSNIKLHLKSCKADKESIYLTNISLKEKENEILRKQVNDLQEKLYNIANKSTSTTINTTTYNTILNCDKPLVLDKEYVEKQLIDYCEIPYLRRGGEGICDWFLDSVCTNEKGNLCIECVDKSRKMFKFEDINKKINEISGKEIVDLIKMCFPKFKKTLHYLSFLQDIEEYCKSNYSEEELLVKQYEYLYAIDNMHNEFINRLVSKTHKGSFNTLLKSKDDFEE